VAFISALIDRLEATDAADPDRVYVTGLSRGAMMTYRLGCELSRSSRRHRARFGNMATADGSADVPCTLARPVSVLAIHGTADGTIPIAGGTVDITFSPLIDVIARWRDLDSCTGAQAVAVDGASTTTSWACRGGSAVEMRVVGGGGTPGRSDRHPRPHRTRTTSTPSRLIADFFMAHRESPPRLTDRRTDRRTSGGSGAPPALPVVALRPGLRVFALRPCRTRRILVS